MQVHQPRRMVLQFSASQSASCLHELILHHKKVCYPYVDNEKRPDIVVFDSGVDSSTDLDIALSHLCSHETMKGSATTDGYAATLREDRKCAKYQHGNSPVFTAVVLNILEAGETGQ